MPHFCLQCSVHTKMVSGHNIDAILGLLQSEDDIMFHADENLECVEVPKPKLHQAKLTFSFYSALFESNSPQRAHCRNT